VTFTVVCRISFRRNYPGRPSDFIEIYKHI
jgi:hypothetical protein